MRKKDRRKDGRKERKRRKQKERRIERKSRKEGRKGWKDGRKEVKFWAGVMAKVVEYLPSKGESLSTNPSNTTKKIKIIMKAC